MEESCRLWYTTTFSRDPRKPEWRDSGPSFLTNGQRVLLIQRTMTDVIHTYWKKPTGDCVLADSATYETTRNGEEIVAVQVTVPVLHAKELFERGEVGIAFLETATNVARQAVIDKYGTA